MTRLAAALLAVLLLAACAPQGPTPGTAPVPSRADLVPDTHDGPLTTTGTVLEDAGHGPQLCVGAVATSYPPQCGGPDVLGFSFDDVPAGAYGAAVDSRWGHFALTGVVERLGDRDAVRLTAPPRPATEPLDPPLVAEFPVDFTTPCPAPAGGRTEPDPARAGDDALGSAGAVAPGVPGYTLLWIDEQAPGHRVLNVSTAGDLAAMESAVRQVWGGALCVSPAQRSEADLARVREEVEASVAPLVLDVQLDAKAGRVTATALLARESDQQRLDERYGPGVVRLSSVLRVPSI
ncbi:hypothetical protein ACFEMC_19590 [Kineococcus sp. DHX-1]|uniref:hypothetical protein n=1 Tax=Kineococcus sp. DHX-1 TaxID=3349638 RepID=UPI0036D4124A